MVGVLFLKEAELMRKKLGLKKKKIKARLG